MSTLNEILNPKQQVEDGWTAILKKANANVFPVFSLEESKITPYIECTLANLRVSDKPQQHPYQSGTSEEELLYTSWSGTMITRVVTNRNTNSDKHVPMVGLVTVESARFRMRFNPATLPFHAVLDMKQSGLVETTDGLTDRTEISHEMLIVVRDDAWDGI
jgi:hypothetical protein